MLWIPFYLRRLDSMTLRYPRDEAILKIFSGDWLSANPRQAVLEVWQVQCPAYLVDWISDS